jgi:ketosteroid isomerase-like protein
MIEKVKARPSSAAAMVSLTLAAVSEAVQTNLELARQSYALWNASGVDAVLERFWAPDIVFYDLPEAPDTGVFRGAEEVAARLRAVLESWDHLPQFEVRSLEGWGDYTLATVELRVEGQGSGVALGVPQFHVARWADGQTSELRIYLDGDQARQEYERLRSQSA